MSAALASYLSALDARDSRERAHEVYINAYTQFADRTAAQHAAGGVATAAAPSTTTAPAPTSTKRTSSPAPPSTNTNTTLTQLQTALASSQKSRAELESTVSSLTASLTTLQATSTAQQTRIAALEKHRAQLERRGKDKQEELKGKGRFVEEIQDEMVALNLQLNMAEKERERLKAENEELTKRWVRKMEEEVGRMNRESGWEVQGR